MSDERVKYEGSLAVNRQKRVAAQVRIQGLVRSLRDLLDPILPVERLEGLLISSQAMDLANQLVTYRELLAEADVIKRLLGR